MENDGFETVHLNYASAFTVDPKMYNGRSMGAHFKRNATNASVTDVTFTLHQMSPGYQELTPVLHTTTGATEAHNAAQDGSSSYIYVASIVGSVFSIVASTLGVISFLCLIRSESRETKKRREERNKEIMQFVDNEKDRIARQEQTDMVQDIHRTVVANNGRHY